MGAASSSVVVIDVTLGGHAMCGLGCDDTHSLDPEKQLAGTKKEMNEKKHTQGPNGSCWHVDLPSSLLVTFLSSCCCFPIVSPLLPIVGSPLFLVIVCLLSHHFSFSSSLIVTC